jgi:hypothetical protein
MYSRYTSFLDKEVDIPVETTELVNFSARTAD